MSRVLMTGFMAHHASESANARVTRFSGGLFAGLNQAGVDVTMNVPRLLRIDEMLDTYSHFIVGIGPFSSVAANYSYGSLLLLSRLWDSGRVTILMDADKPRYVRSGLVPIRESPSTLFKEFYAQRPDHKAFFESEALTRELRDVVDRLLSEPWPETIAPQLPWYSTPYESAVLDVTNGSQVTGVPLDALLIGDTPGTPVSADRRVKAWVAEDPRNNWVKTARKSMQNRVESVTILGLHDVHVHEALRHRIGLLVGTDAGRIRWTNRISQAMTAGVPVCTEWRDTHVLGESWSMLPVALEAMSFSEVNEVAEWQHEQYKRALPGREEVLQQLRDLVAHDEGTTK